MSFKYSQIKWLKKYEDRVGFQMIKGEQTYEQFVSSFNTIVGFMNIYLYELALNCVSKNSRGNVDKYSNTKRADFIFTSVFSFISTDILDSLQKRLSDAIPNDPMITARYVQNFAAECTNYVDEYIYKRWLEFRDELDHLYKLKPNDQESVVAIDKVLLQWGSSNYSQKLAQESNLLNHHVEDQIDAEFNKILNLYATRLGEKRKELSGNISNWINTLGKVDEKDRDFALITALSELKTIVDKNSGKLTQNSVKDLTSFLKKLSLRSGIIGIKKRSKYDPIHNSDVPTQEIVLTFIYAITEDNSEKKINRWFESYKGK